MYRYLLLSFALALSACATQPSKEQANADTAPGERVKPIESFEKVGEPRRRSSGMARGPVNLSTDVERLQDAKRAYKAERAFEAAQTRHRQQECRQSKKGEEVPIEDGSEDPATYCQETGNAGDEENHPEE